MPTALRRRQEPRGRRPARGLTIELGGLEPLDPGVRADLLRMIRAKAEPVIARYAVPASKIELAIAWHDVETFDYRIRLKIAAHEGMEARSDDRPTGPDTEQPELGDVVEAACERALVTWTRDHERAVAGVKPATNATTPPPRDETVAKRSRLRAMGWAGVGLLGAGVASLGAGIALMVIEPTPHPTDDSKLRSWRPGGVAFLVVGGAALVGGAVLLARDTRRGSRRAVVAFAPSLGRRGAGATVSVRF